MLKRTIWIFIVFILCGAIGCKKDSKSDLQGVEIIKNSDDGLKINSPMSLRFRTIPKNFPTDSIKSISWKSSDTDVIKITNSDKNPCIITGLKRGTASIMVMANGVPSDEVPFNVVSSRSGLSFQTILNIILLIALALACCVIWYFIKKPNRTNRTRKPEDAGYIQQLEEGKEELRKENKALINEKDSIRSELEKKHKQIQHAYKKKKEKSRDSYTS
jgi:hypothetical protein